VRKAEKTEAKCNSETKEPKKKKKTQKIKRKEIKAKEK
jgi:hypothetical protein